VFEYFPENYNWSLATALATGMGGELAEIDAACRPLRAVAAAATTDEAQRDWIDSWTALAQRTREAAELDDAANHVLTAARRWRRVAVYELMAERMISNLDPAKNATYRRALDAVGGWTRRGLSVLVCDQPGSGEALRFHGLTARLHTEGAAAA
jgi:hypothetical protein